MTIGKQRAQRLIEALKGVRAVANQVRVQPSGRSDKEILSDVKFALDEDPVTELGDLQVNVAIGAVTLRGVVDSFSERALAGRAVTCVLGVVGLDNQITVDAKQRRPDDEIYPEIKRYQRELDAGGTVISVFAAEKCR